MLTNIWSITLLVSSLAVLFLIGRAAYTAVRVMLYWQTGADTSRQIELENETWLSAALVQSGLLIQIINLFLLVLAAEEFSQVLAGAMCATGSFLANSYGFPSLLVKLSAVFLYGFWLLLHRLDVKSEHCPLTRIKHIYILGLIPVIFVDIILQTLYLYSLHPDIITSCCGVIFAPSGQGGVIFSESYSVSVLLSIFYSLAFVIFLIQLWIIYCSRKKQHVHVGLYWSLCFIWLMYFPFTLLVLTIVISSYIYAMPYHHCPFDMLKGQYYWVGYPLYLTLIGSAFLGISGGAACLLAKLPGLEQIVPAYQRSTASIGFWFFGIFLILASYAPFFYFFAGGEF